MSQTETLQPEAGDDRNWADVTKLHEMFNAPSVPEPGPGDVLMQQATLSGHLLLKKAGISILN